MVTRSVFVVAAEGASVKSIVALGLADLLSRQTGRVGVFRPVTPSPDLTTVVDPVVDLLLAHPLIDQDRRSAIGVTYADVHRDPAAAHAEIVRRFSDLAARYDALVVLGSDFADVATPGELSFNARVAADLAAPVVLVVSGRGRTPVDVRAVADVALAELAAAHAQTVAVIANRVDPGAIAPVAGALASLSARRGSMPTGVIPEVPVLVAPPVSALFAACDATLLRGNPQWLKRESMGFVVAAMSLPNVLTRLRPGATVIAPGDRSDLLPGLALAHQAGTHGHLSAIVLTGGYRPPAPIAALLDGLDQDLPIAVSPHDTFDTASLLADVRGRLTADSPVKVQTALRVFADSIDEAELTAALDVPASPVVTPLMFGYRLLERARSARRRIVLAEGHDDRIITAAAILTRRGVADLTLLGIEPAIRARAAALGLDLTGVAVVSPTDPALVDEFATEYARLRAHKGVSMEQARRTVADPSYFATMMVHLGRADGMVSGAAHTTAETIRPAFEIIRTAPGTSVVSSVFLMCLADRVLVYGDCAVIPDPTAEQLADIAISAAATAARFGIEPRIAMLSYSTGSSGRGADVDKVRAATDLVRGRRPDLVVDGPMQYDAAVDEAVAAAKAPGSPVAGHATVLIFPDLNTGNNTYKAVQRTAGVVAIGPVLQGLAKPVNDLSRGALVDDIVDTVAITAIQAQQGSRRR
ncbi:MAG TPA: phosphate acetyltransferase [Mycobacterium sp.]